MNPFKEYFKQQWILGMIDNTYLQNQVNKGRITSDDLVEITSIVR